MPSRVSSEPDALGILLRYRLEDRVSSDGGAACIDCAFYICGFVCDQLSWVCTSRRHGFGLTSTTTTNHDRHFSWLDPKPYSEGLALSTTISAAWRHNNGGYIGDANYLRRFLSCAPEM